MNYIFIISFVEKLVDLWGNHLNISVFDGEVNEWKIALMELLGRMRYYLNIDSYVRTQRT